MINRDKILKGLLLIGGIIVLVSLLTQTFKKNSQTLEDYAKENPEIAYMEKSESQESESAENLHNETTSTPTSTPTPTPAPSSLIGATLNADTLIDQRFTYAESFYYEPLSENLRRYITGVSYPAVAMDSDEGTPVEKLAITYDDLCYLHILHYDFDGNPAEGELICNKAIAQDLVEIFYELYLNEYQLESVRLIDEYDGDDTASMEDNNTSCFNYRVVPNSTSLSKHALGLALDINPLYNPYITYQKDETGKIIGENVSPANGLPYADRSTNFPYKIDENDLCYKLFTEHGFTWGGNWNSSKDYQHFQKVVKQPERSNQAFANTNSEMTADELLDLFINGSINAVDPADSTSTFYITDLNLNSEEWDSHYIGERVDLDNDGENELIICGPYGGIYLDARDNAVYELAVGDGNANRLSYTYYNGAIWIMYGNSMNAGYEAYYLARYEGADNLIAEIRFGEELVDANNPESGMKYLLNGNEISYDEYTAFCSKIFAAEVSTN